MCGKTVLPSGFPCLCRYSWAGLVWTIWALEIKCTMIQTQLSWCSPSSSQQAVLLCTTASCSQAWAMAVLQLTCRASTAHPWKREQRIEFLCGQGGGTAVRGFGKFACLFSYLSSVILRAYWNILFPAHHWLCFTQYPFFQHMYIELQLFSVSKSK